MFRVEGKKFFILWLAVPILCGTLYPVLKENALYFKWLNTALVYYVLFFSVLVHELSHGLAAGSGGDVTARSAGRLSLNPIVHVSVVGSIIVPLALFYFNAPFVLGWAKGVPFNPVNLKKYPRDQIFLTIAGPLSNFILSFLCLALFLIFGLIFNHWHPENQIFLQLDVFEPSVGPEVPGEAFYFILFQILNVGLFINLILGIFNLIPFPPLDGSWLLKALLPRKVNVFYNRIQWAGFFLLILALQLDLLRIFIYPIVVLLLIIKGISDFILLF